MLLMKKLSAVFKLFFVNRYYVWLIILFNRRFLLIWQGEFPLVGNVAPDFQAEAVFDQEFINVSILYQFILTGQLLILLNKCMKVGFCSINHKYLALFNVKTTHKPPSTILTFCLFFVKFVSFTFRLSFQIIEGRSMWCYSFTPWISLSYVPLV